MSVEEFAKYAIDNMHRASLVNAFNIADKLDNLKFYSLSDFIDNCIKYVSELQSMNKISPQTASRVLVALYNCDRDYNSDFKYNKKMVIDNLIIELWEAFCKNTRGN